MEVKIEIGCPCGHRWRVDVDRLGTKGACPACGEDVLIWSREVAGTAVDRNWYLELQGRTRGPVTFVELRRLVSEGRVTRETPVRYGRDGAWMLAADARGDIDVAVAAAVPVVRRRRDPLRRPRPAVAVSPEHVRLGLALLAVALLVPLLLLVLRKEEEARPPPRLTTAEIAGRVLPSVAAIRGKHGSGSGFVVSPGVLVTSYHVVARELLRYVTVEFPSAAQNPGSFAAELRYADPEGDIAMLSVPDLVRPLALAERHEFQPGQEILVVGSPGLGGGGLILPNALGRGLLSTQMEIEGTTFYQLDVSVNPGNSGGPVVDDQGRVIGLVTAKAAGEEHVAFALPLPDLQRAVHALETSSPDDVRRMSALHRLRVAESAILPAAQVYYVAMVSYIRTLDPRYADDQVDAPEGDVTSLLAELDRTLLADLRLEEATIREDRGLTPEERDRFVRLWKAYAELKSAVDVPEGSLREYVSLCQSLRTRLARISAELDASRR